MSSSLSRMSERWPRFTATAVGTIGCLAGYLLCYLVGLILLPVMMGSLEQSELESALLGVTDPSLFVAGLVCGWPIFLTVGLLVGLPLNELRTHYRWPAKRVHLIDLAASAILGALICGPWNAFVLFATFAYGE